MRGGGAIQLPPQDVAALDSCGVVARNVPPYYGLSRLPRLPAREDLSEGSVLVSELES
jgi:hypothetical protein